MAFLLIVDWLKLPALLLSDCVAAPSGTMSVRVALAAQVCARFLPRLSRSLLAAFVALYTQLQPRIAARFARQRALYTVLIHGVDGFNFQPCITSHLTVKCLVCACDQQK